MLSGVGLPPIEIIPKQGFYDYKNKYQSGLALEICPAELTPEQDAAARAAALAVHGTLRLGSYSRIDFILDAETGAVRVPGGQHSARYDALQPAPSGGRRRRNQLRRAVRAQ